jgi:hypothetical protein
MNIEIIKKDILSLEKALKIIEKTDCYMLFNKSKLIFEICESISILKEKKDKQQIFLNSI